jgi:flagella synthesis protein FlgN
MAIASPNKTLADEQQHIAALVELMKREQQLLIDADADGLAEITPQKAQLVQHLATLSVERHRALGAAGFAAAESGMEPWLAVSGDAEVRAGWDGLLELTREAKELNRVNGMLINKQMAHTQNVLNAVRPPSASADAGVYGASGQTVTGGPSRKFVIG